MALFWPSPIENALLRNFLGLFLGILPLSFL